MAVFYEAPVYKIKQTLFEEKNTYSFYIHNNEFLIVSSSAHTEKIRIAPCRYLQLRIDENFVILSINDREHYFELKKFITDAQIDAFVYMLKHFIKNGNKKHKLSIID